MFTGGDPVLLGAGVDLEDVGPGAEDGLLSAQRRGRDKKGKGGRDEAVRKCFLVRLSFLIYQIVTDRQNADFVELKWLQKEVAPL